MDGPVVAWQESITQDGEQEKALLFRGEDKQARHDQVHGLEYGSARHLMRQGRDNCTWQYPTDGLLQLYAVNTLLMVSIPTAS